MIWVIADTHFHHENMIKRGIRPPDYEEKIIKNWNSQVKDEDIVIVLGDVAWNNKYDVLKSLKGRKILVKGNHDYKSCRTYMEKYFDFACETFSMTYQGIPIIFSHEPLKWFNELYNIHGHLHSMVHRKDTGRTPAHILISLELMGYNVFSLDYILFKLTKKKEY